MRRPYVRTAVLKGLPRRTVVFKHVLRNALLPTITVIAIKNVFNYPVLGRLLLFAIDRRDFPLMQATGIVVVIGVVLAVLITNLLYAAVNPRIRYR